MSDPQPFPLWLIPLFPLFFIGMWLFVTAILSAIGGWGELARLYPEPADSPRSPAAAFPSASLDLRRGWMPLPVNYNRCVVVDFLPAGLHLRTWAVFRFRHPPLLIPWSAIERLEHGRMLFWPILTLHVRGTGTRIRMHGGVAKAVEEVARQFAARPAEPAPV